MAKIINNRPQQSPGHTPLNKPDRMPFPGNNPPGEIKELQWIEKISRYLDTAFVIPGTRFRFGLDPLLGLFPIAGDLVSFGMSAIMILSMVKHGASRKVVILMIGNIVIDTIVGSIPILGNIFDFTFKANQRNLKLLKEHQLEGKHTGSGTGRHISRPYAVRLCNGDMGRLALTLHPVSSGLGS